MSKSRILCKPPKCGSARKSGEHHRSTQIQTIRIAILLPRERIRKARNGMAETMPFLKIDETFYKSFHWSALRLKIKMPHKGDEFNLIH